MEEQKEVKIGWLSEVTLKEYRLILKECMSNIQEDYAGMPIELQKELATTLFIGVTQTLRQNSWKK